MAIFLLRFLDGLDLFNSIGQCAFKFCCNLFLGCKCIPNWVTILLGRNDLRNYVRKEQEAEQAEEKLKIRGVKGYKYVHVFYVFMYALYRYCNLFGLVRTRSLRVGCTCTFCQQHYLQSSDARMDVG